MNLNVPGREGHGKALMVAAISPLPDNEDQDVTFGTGIDDALDDISRLFGDRPFVVVVKITNLNGKTLTFGNQNGARRAVGRREVIRDRLGVERSGHDKHL